MDSVDHSDPDYGAAWNCINTFGGVDRTLSEVVLEVEEVHALMGDLEETLSNLFLLAFLAGAKYGRSVFYQMG